MPNDNTRVYGTTVRRSSADSYGSPKRSGGKSGESNPSHATFELRDPTRRLELPTRRASRPMAREEDALAALSFGERMLRNTALCVALLLCALAVQGLDLPLAQTVSSELRNWVTMDLDESLGSLKFVQNLLPDAALVFWHIGATDAFEHPVSSAVSHSWQEQEPWLVYASAEIAEILAAAAGEVMSVVYRSDDSATVRLRHENGLETLYGNLSACSVREGDWVEASDSLGKSDTLYFEIRSEGRSMNPAPLMAKKP